MNPQQKLVVGNLALVLYFVLPNLTSLVLIVALLALHLCPDCSISSLCCSQTSNCSINGLFNLYLETPLSRSTPLPRQNCWLSSPLVWPPS
jgi:hypothetical protein